jgi:hypothetical protein
MDMEREAHGSAGPDGAACVLDHDPRTGWCAAQDGATWPAR